MLGLNTSVLQFAMAAGAGIGGVIIDHISLHAIIHLQNNNFFMIAAAQTCLHAGSRQAQKREARTTKHF